VSDPLEDWIRTCHVCWDIEPLRPRMDGGHPGFELSLLARCEGALDPAGKSCQEAYERLVEIVRRVLPPEAPCHLEAFDTAVHLRPESAFAPEVELVVEVFPEAAAALHVQPSVRAALGRLGVRAHAWSDASTPGHGLGAARPGGG
jgi:hypothetical protein